MKRSADRLRRFASMGVIGPLLATALLSPGGPARSNGAATGGAPRSGVEKWTLDQPELALLWQSAPALRQEQLTNKSSGKVLRLGPEVFTLTLADGAALRSSDMQITVKPALTNLAGDPKATRKVDRRSSKRLRVILEDPKRGLRATVTAILSAGTSYLREELVLEAVNRDVPLKEVCLAELSLPGARTAGRTAGAPVVADNLFLGVESPLAVNTVEGERVRCVLPYSRLLPRGRTMQCSVVIGFARKGQIRRDFLAYLEQQRARPYHPFLHYNSWYDLGVGVRYDQKAALHAVDAIGKELHTRRGVTLDSFLFDDGWDDLNRLWEPNAGLPAGFAPIAAATQRLGAHPGAWLSPWGGYGDTKQQRLKFDARSGYETNAAGFSLSGPVYFKYVRDVCLKLVREDRVNAFKFDGFSSATAPPTGAEFSNDAEAMIRLCGELRRENPGLYINVTNGSWASPFWLLSADSIWRGGLEHNIWSSDHNFLGAGSNRQRWITYRDASTYHSVVQASELYPLNSLMLHGVIYARQAQKLDKDPNGDFSDEVRSFFGSGTQLQELYISPELLTAKDWDVLAEAADWSRANSDVFADVHWIGGDPIFGPYGWAAWTPRKGILTLRNPRNRPRSMMIDVQSSFELPPGAPRRYRAETPWRDGMKRRRLELTAGRPSSIELKPFEVLTLEAFPIPDGKNLPTR